MQMLPSNLKNTVVLQRTNHSFIKLKLNHLKGCDQESDLNFRGNLCGQKNTENCVQSSLFL